MLALLAFRPLRHWWLDVGWIALAVAIGVPQVAAAVLVRMIVTGAVLLHWRTEAAVGKPRRELLPTMTGRERDRLLPPEEAFTHYLGTLADDDDPGGGRAEYLGSTWTSGDGLALARAVTKIVRIEVLGRTPEPSIRLSPMRRIAHLAAIELAVNLGPRWLLVAVGAATAWFTLPALQFGIGSLHLTFQPVGTILTATLALCAARPRPAYKSAVGLAVLVLWLAGNAAIPSLTAVTAGAAGASALRRAVTRRMVNTPPRMWWVGRRVVGWRDHQRYRAASVLAARRPGTAIHLLTEIAGAARDRRPAAAAAALAHSALIELDRGRLQPAVEHAEEAVTLASTGRSEVAEALAAYTMGMVQFALGSYPKVIAKLELAEPVLTRRPEGATCASVLAQSYAATAQEEAALAAASRVVGRPTAPGQLPALVESQVAAGWALLRSGKAAEARRVMSNLESMPNDPFASGELNPSDRDRELWSRLTGESSLLLGRIQLTEHKLDEAQASLRKAASHLRRTSAADLLGMARIYQGECYRLQDRWNDATASVRAGTELLEARRRMLQLGTNRATAVAAGSDHYNAALGVLVGAQRNGDLEAGAAAASLVESLRRNGLAGVLREEQVALIERLSPAGHEAMREIARQELAPDTSVSPDISPGNEKSLEALRAKLAEEVTAAFARAYLPAAVDYTRLAESAGPAHILQFEMFETGPTQWHGYRIWVPPYGAPWVDRVTITDPGALRILEASRQGAKEHAFYAPFADVMAEWAALAKALLPPGLIRELGDRTDSTPIRLLVVPGDHLAYLPWAPLLLDAQDVSTVLLNKAIIQLVPSLDLLDRPGRARRVGTVLAYLDDKALDDISKGGPATRAWERLTQTLPIELAMSKEEFERLLSDPRTGAIHLIAHGDGTGLAQGIKFSRGGLLSATSALRLRWPPSIVLASCFVARVEQRTGQEPLGLVVACMLGGCRTVIGGVIEVEWDATVAITADISTALAEEVHPAVALRDAQRAFLAAQDDPSDPFTNEWAGLVCISTELSHQP
jgi:tetratricopeptide (TPR) repeat protein